ncbi:hypothetical protein ISS30_04360 [bacterium]|nr:hypothetical protein [bacterium]
MRKITPIFSILVVLIFTISLSAQQKYERKSISYIDALWLASPQAKSLNVKQVDYILATIKETFEMPRFDYNPLPENLLREFIKSARQDKSLTVDEIARLMEAHLIPAIVEILQGAMPERAGELVSEAQKQSFMATKAKEIGITLEEIEKVMNSAYIYLPVMTGYEVTKSKDSDKFTIKIEGGIIWFHIDTGGDKPKVELKVANTTTSQGFGSKEFAYTSAVDNFARNLQVATRDIEEFKLGAAIDEVQGKYVTFGMGKKEGVFIDDCYWVGEYMMKGGERKFVKTGWVRVGEVGDNKRDPIARSTAWAVKKGDWAPGMMLIEHPRLNIDIAFKIIMCQMNISKGTLPLYEGDLTVKDEYDGFAPGCDISAQMNIGSLMNSGQTFFIIGGTFAFANLEFESNTLTDMKTSIPFTWGIHGGLMKKAYFGQLAFVGEAEVGALFFSVQQKFWAGEDYDYTIKNSSIGFQAGLGLEYAHSPDLNFGLRAGYRFYSVADVWDVDGSEYNPDDYTDYNFPKVDHSGLTISLYLHYTPPALPFDPIALLRGAAGE